MSVSCQKRSFADPLFDHSVGFQEDPLRDVDPERCRGLAIDNKFEDRRRFDGQVAGPRALQYPVHVDLRFQPCCLSAEIV
jgi:hypothetical protein